MKRIIMSLGMLAFVGAVVVGGTGAFFSDTETSTGNVFTAGSVSLALTNIEHDYLGDENAIPENYFVYSANSADPENGPSYAFTDLKPLDNGSITSTLENGANDAFVCKRIVAAEGMDEDLINMVCLRTGTGPGATFGEFFDMIGIGEWFSPTAPSLGLSSLALDAGEEGTYSIEYCFGEFTPGSALGEGCVLDEDVEDYNIAQEAEFLFDVEYYAVQQRNNGDFTCADLNEDKTWSEPILSSANADNIVDNKPHINWSINENILEIEFVNPTNFQFGGVFDYRIDGEVGTPDANTGNIIGGTSELAGTDFGNRFNGVIPGANTSTTLTFDANDFDEKIEVIFRRGPENDWYFDFIEFQVN